MDVLRDIHMDLDELGANINHTNVRTGVVNTNQSPNQKLETPP